MLQDLEHWSTLFPSIVSGWECGSVLLTRVSQPRGQDQKGSPFPKHAGQRTCRLWFSFPWASPTAMRVIPDFFFPGWRQSGVCWGWHFSVWRPHCWQQEECDQRPLVLLLRPAPLLAVNSVVGTVKQSPPFLKFIKGWEKGHQEMKTFNLISVTSP